MGQKSKCVPGGGCVQLTCPPDLVGRALSRCLEKGIKLASIPPLKVLFLLHPRLNHPIYKPNYLSIFSEVHLHHQINHNVSLLLQLLLRQLQLLLLQQLHPLNMSPRVA